MSGPGPTVTLDVAAACTECPDVDRVRELVERVLNGESVQWHEIGVVLADHDLVHDLNRRFLNHDYQTDVLSFLLDEGPAGIEGEVYVDVETARERSSEFDTTVRQEIERYIVHGLLHLAGHDDADDAARAAMHDRENLYLAQ